MFPAEYIRHSLPQYPEYFNQKEQATKYLRSLYLLPHTLILSDFEQ